LPNFLNSYEQDETKDPVTRTSYKLNERVLYSEGTGHDHKYHVIQTTGHVMPNFVGEWFLRNDVPELQKYYQTLQIVENIQYQYECSNVGMNMQRKTILHK
jgi:hypothetical protein